jgi:predicted acyltransferase
LEAQKHGAVGSRHSTFAAGPSDTGARDASSPTEPPPRLISLDALRGLALASMLVVNNPGSWSEIYAPLRHAEWHGCTYADLVFPAFLLVVGAAIAVGPRARAAHVLGRSALLIGLGLFLNGFPTFPLDTWRIAGVLQRIGVCYAFAVLAQRALPPSGRLALESALLIGYHVLLVFGSAPGAPRGDLSPGGFFGAPIDQALFGRDRIWNHGCVDPEGVVSTLGACATVLIGLRFGELARAHGPGAALASRLAVGGVLHLVVGWLWSLALPLNKALWTPSFVVWASGACLCAWAALEACGLGLEGARAGVGARASLRARGLGALSLLGRHALYAYVGSTVLARLLAHVRIEQGERVLTPSTWLYEHVTAVALGPRLGSLASALWMLALWWWLVALWHRLRQRGAT